MKECPRLPKTCRRQPDRTRPVLKRAYCVMEGNLAVVFELTADETEIG